MILAVIPARGRSKRIPHKNIRNFCGRPIIAYTINSCSTVVGSFSEKIVKICNNFSENEVLPCKICGHTTLDPPCVRIDVASTRN